MVVSADYLQSRADFSPWEGLTLKGWAVRTVVRGRTVMRDGEIVGDEGFGTLPGPPGPRHRVDLRPVAGSGGRPAPVAGRGVLPEVAGGQQ